MSINDESTRHEAILDEKAQERLLAVGRKVFREAYPNPERFGAIGSSVLKAAAKSSHREPLSAELVDALTWSSETFAEYERYLREARFGRKMQYLAACAAIVVALGAALWWSLGPAGTSRDERPKIAKEAPTPQGTPAPEVVPDTPRKESPPQPTYEVAVLDLRKQSPVRGEPGAAPNNLPIVPAKRVELTVYLPIGSEEGEYEVALLKAPGEPLTTTSGQAALVDQIVLLRTQMDLSALQPATYFWGLRRGEFRWAYYQIRVE